MGLDIYVYKKNPYEKGIDDESNESDESDGYNEFIEDYNYNLDCYLLRRNDVIIKYLDEYDGISVSTAKMFEVLIDLLARLQFDKDTEQIKESIFFFSFLLNKHEGCWVRYSC